MRTKIELNCHVCGRKFIVNKGKEKKTCTKKCRLELRKITDEKYYEIKKCIVCENEFRSKKRENKKCCSYECAGKLKTEKSQEKRICINCGNEFTERKKYDRKLCSEQCRLDWQLKPENIKKRIDKSKMAVLEKYGEEFTFKIDEFQNKVQNIRKIKYNEIGWEEMNRKIKETKKLKYNDENYNNIKKIQQTKDIKYNNKNYNNRVEFKKTINRKLNSRLLNIGYSVVKYIDDDFLLIKHPDGHIFETPRTLLIIRLNENRELSTKYMKHSPNISNSELEISSFLNENSIIHKTSLKNIIKPYEIDIYIPNIKLGIEFNGLYWHSDHYKSPNFHLKKTDMCNEKNINLLHIMEDEWINRKDIVKSIMLKKMNIYDHIIQINQTTIKEIYNNEYNEFLNKNSIFGETKSSIKYAIFYKNEIISVIGIRKNKNNVYDINRYCEKNYYSIKDGLKILLEYFIYKHNPKIITTSIDRRYFTGNEYIQLGFELFDVTKPNFFYSDYRNMKRYKKNNYKKNNNIDLPKIYDCGLLKYRLKIKPTQ